MLVDVDVPPPADQRMASILSILSDGNPNVVRLDRGLYEVNHHNFDTLLGEAVVDRYPCDGYDKVPADSNFVEFITEWMAAHPGLPPSYGVCDTPSQLVNKYPTLDTDPRPLVASFTPIHKSAQHPHGGWRWHKWGTYIGEQQRVGCEYLADEPHIELVYTYQIIEIAPWAAIEGTD